MSSIPTLVWGKTCILFVMATDQEYRDALQQRIPPLIIGIGPVEAAIGTTSALAELNAKPGAKPDMVVSLGSAGSATLEQGAVYEVSSVSYRDMDASLLGFEKGVTPFLDLPANIPLETRIDGVPKASLSTGANIVSGDTYTSIGADLADMESFAVLRACQAFDVPFVGLRGVSDGAEELRHFNDWADYLPAVDAALAEALDRLKSQLETE
ncbi:MAG: 5'-methylthioadenosine/S-adenosylhomocysteine nucleosidase [Pseudomonadota bacterium]